MGQLNFTKQANETVYNTMLAYYDIVRLQQQVKAIKEVILLNEERLKIADTRFRIGSAAKTDLLQAQVDLNSQQSLLVSLENDISNGKTNLNAVLSRDPSTNFSITDSFNFNSTVDYISMLQKIDKQNPDLLLANSNLTVLMQTKKEINAQRLPGATLTTNYNFARNKSDAGFTLLNQNYGPSAGIGIAFPIYNAGQVRQQLKVTDINIKNQNIAILQLKNQVLTLLGNAFNNYNNGNKLAAMEEKNLLLIRENNFINMERFKKLSITSIELRQGQLNYTDAQTRLINAQFQSKIAEAEMMLLTGEIAL
jgi:outer membrane protein TolC